MTPKETAAMHAVLDAPASAVVLPFPPAASQRLLSRVALLTLAGKPFASTSFLPGAGPGAAWNWIVETVAHEVGCAEADVHAGEGEDGCDVITVDGLPVYQVEITRPPQLLQ